MDKTKKAKVNIPMCAAGILFCLVLISTHFTGGLYAKYVARGSGSDSARVITFGNITVTEEGSFYKEDQLIILPGVDIVKKAYLSFTGSESDTYIFVEIELPKGKWQTNNKFNFKYGGTDYLPWSIDDDEWDFVTTVSADTTETYVYCKYLDSNNALNNVNIFGNNGVIPVSDEITKKDLPSMQGLYINIKATAVQAGGFKDASEAYNSVASK